MFRSRRIIFVTLIAVSVSVGGLLLWWRSENTPRLPAIAHYPERTSIFNERLASARQAALARPADPTAIRALAHLYQANQLDAEARACYTWLEKSGGGLIATDHRLLADLALRAGDLPGAVTALKNALAADPSYLPARVVLAECLFKSGETQEAAKEYGAVLAQAPNQPQALLGLARVALQEKNDDVAIGHLEQLIATHPEATSGIALLAQVLTRRGDIERASALTERSRQRPDPLPADPWLDALWADCYDAQQLTLHFEALVNSGQLDEALPLVNRVAELDPASWLPDFLRGWSLSRAHRPKDALLEYRRALDKSGDPERILPIFVATLHELDRAKEAEDVVNRALLARPDSISLLTLQSDLVARRHGDVRPLLVALLQREPYLYRANMDLAQILLAKGERPAALECLTRVAKAYPLDVPSRGLLGEYYLADNQPVLAIPPLEQALPQAEAGSAAQQKLSAMLASAYLQAGGHEREAGKITDAAKYFEKAARVRPEGLTALAALVEEAARTKQFPVAVDVLQRLASLQPKNPTIQISLGDLIYQMGDKAAARAHWNEALKLAPPADTALRSAITTRLSGNITPELFE
ncbi:MAG TPA: tetratricopeptide repeat protein [Opitutaceae bacterium]|nr:tetratricopeptide repeat protein [Opitutaceae bacterium]